MPGYFLVEAEAEPQGTDPLMRTVRITITSYADYKGVVGMSYTVQSGSCASIDPNTSGGPYNCPIPENGSVTYYVDVYFNSVGETMTLLAHGNDGNGGVDEDTEFVPQGGWGVATQAGVHAR